MLTKPTGMQEKENRETTEQMENNKMGGLSPNMSTITSNVNGLIYLWKDRHWLGGIKKHDPIICCSQEAQLKYKA